MSEIAENFLGIDWGSRDVGVALAHAETGIAIPFMTECNDAGLADRLAVLINQENIGTVVIGIPSHVNRERVEYPGEKFGRLLAVKANVRICYQDEMFTTKLAHQALIGRGEKAVGKHDDAEAARIILQQWIERQSLKNES